MRNDLLSQTSPKSEKIGISAEKGPLGDANTKDTNSVNNPKGISNPNHISGKDVTRKELNNLLLNNQPLLKHTVLGENLPDLTNYSVH